MTTSKKVLVAFLLFALIPLTAQATITRVIGMGGFDAKYILHDANTPTVWPQLVRNYANLAGAEISGNDFQKAYVNYDFGGEKSAIQISLDKSNSPMFLAGPEFPNSVGGGYNKLNFIYGRPMGDDMLIGLALNYAGKSFKQDENGPGGKKDISYSVIGLNLGWTGLEKKLDLALGFDFASFSDKEGGNEVNKNDGSMDISFAGRYWYQANDKYALIPNIKFMNKKDAYKDPSASATEKGSLTTTMFALGVGNNWTPVEDMLSIFEVGLKSTNDKYEETTAGTAAPAAKETETDIYWRLGFETKIFEWLNGRLGAERNWESLKDETALGKPETGTNVTATYLGASAHWNRLHLDLLVQPAFLQKGPYFISGAGSDGMFSQVSLWYDFNK
jgi:hypothetical protein